VILGKGAFRATADYNEENDLYAFKTGVTKFWTNGPPVDWKSDTTLV
jgi:hypothetical protein